jgi:mannose-6-phosphate isomerase-like protein (cupin superfamily)
MIQSFVREIYFSEADPSFVGWRPYQQFLDATASVSSMSCHYSQLSAGHTPHTPHAHVEDELLIILDGEAQLLVAGSPSDPNPQIEPMSVGQFVYYPAWQHHTIRNNSNRTVTYLMFKWSNLTSQERNYDQNSSRVLPNESVLKTGFFDIRGELNGVHGGGFSTVVVFEGRTGTLEKLHCHLTKLGPGAGYPAHDDPYDVAIVLLDGRITTNGQSIAKSGIAYFGAGTPHDMDNPGSSPATYLVFEFHPLR